eukprot:scaffold242935_cov34-Prasinocladus_malaysianus.AAC.1
MGDTFYNIGLFASQRSKFWCQTVAENMAAHFGLLLKILLIYSATPKAKLFMQTVVDICILSFSIDIGHHTPAGQCYSMHDQLDAP